MTGKPTHTTSKERNGNARPSYQLSSEKWSIHYASLLAVFNSLHNVMNQELFEKHLCNQSSHYKKYGRFPLWREAITCYCQIDTFCCQQRWMGHKGGHWWMHCTYCGVPKGTCPAEAMSNSEKIKPIALAIIKVHLSEGISQFNFFLKFCSNLLKAFRVDLKACLALFYLTNTASSLSGKVRLVFGWWLFMGHAQTFVVSTTCIQHYRTVWCCMIW